MNLSLNIIITSILQNVTKIFQNFFTYDPTQIYLKKKKKISSKFRFHHSYKDKSVSRTRGEIARAVPRASSDKTPRFYAQSYLYFLGRELDRARFISGQGKDVDLRSRTVL